MAQRALVSVSDKQGLDTFVKGLVDLGFEILSTGGTRRFLEESGIPVIDVTTYTEFPEIMDGRVKTLHPKVHGAILGRPTLESDAVAIAEHGIVPFQLVVCNLYPFQETIAKPDVSIPQAIEQIDIGGPSMVRSAAKNHAHVAIVTSPEQYADVLQKVTDGSMDDTFRRKLAAAAFEVTATYDRAIADYMAEITSESDDKSSAFGQQLTLSFRLQESLRYGENPHQKAAFYVEHDAPATSLARAKQRNGKELSYNNLMDLDSAKAIVAEFSQPAACVIKHSNPCGCAVSDSLAVAFDNAHAGDPVSAFGSIIGLNRQVDVATAERLCEPGRFIEAIIAPGYDADAFEVLTTKPKWKKNVRLMEAEFSDEGKGAAEYRRVSGGLLVQDRDDLPQPEDDWKIVTDRQPNDEEMADLRFAWKVCRHVKSNAIVFAKGGMLLGAGAGQMSRLDSSFIAGMKSGDRSNGGVVASDAFFPFRDGIDEAAKAGIKAVIQPGGSRNDEDVIAACNEYGMAMVVTGRRHFRH
ncbi:MAG: bifunctional phosphoribosylaminoimidazolecarboxamide formyltransferase/IMP cyclohydrolase [Fuerstiella sp.]|nr:bifunctional phosphoribosylaminoimidazolecarboxamide formyltransferase/IMP cyclohydrolase [Fuerstiella sp.]MCP4858435.1 bifunctional phosphoribosylaminoimidazolecarboxamide formyltransferase/IMP cyclohydrolase [Fuerstiella sp.]